MEIGQSENTNLVSKCLSNGIPSSGLKLELVIRLLQLHFETATNNEMSVGEGPVSFTGISPDTVWDMLRTVDMNENGTNASI